MAITRPDEYRHNNRDLAIADSDSVRGGRRVVDDRPSLYALAPKADQLKEGVTIVRVLSDGENGGGPTEVLLVDAGNIGSSAGWELYATNNNPGSGSGTALVSYPFSFPVTVAGAQSFALPAGTQDVFFVQAQTEYEIERPLSPSHYRVSAGNLVIDADASLVAGETVEGKRYTGGGGTGSGTGSGSSYTDDQARAANQQAIADASTADRDRANHTGTQDASTITGVFTAAQMPALADTDIAALVQLLKPYLDQIYAPK